MLRNTFGYCRWDIKRYNYRSEVDFKKMFLKSVGSAWLCNQRFLLTLYGKNIREGYFIDEYTICSELNSSESSGGQRSFSLKLRVTSGATNLYSYSWQLLVGSNCPWFLTMWSGVKVKLCGKIYLFRLSQSVVALIFNLWVISSVVFLAPGQLNTILKVILQ